MIPSCLMIRYLLILSNHWERRTLLHEVMNGYLSRYTHKCIHSCGWLKAIVRVCTWTHIFYRDYDVLSEFTVGLLEDSGWYKANYTALYNLKQNPLQWGKGISILTWHKWINLSIHNRLGVCIFNGTMYQSKCISIFVWYK